MLLRKQKFLNLDVITRVFKWSSRRYAKTHNSKLYARRVIDASGLFLLLTAMNSQWLRISCHPMRWYVHLRLSIVNSLTFIVQLICVIMIFYCCYCCCWHNCNKKTKRQQDIYLLIKIVQIKTHNINIPYTSIIYDVNHMSSFAVYLAGLNVMKGACSCLTKQLLLILCLPAAQLMCFIQL